MNEKAEKALFKPLDEYIKRLKRQVRQEFMALSLLGFDELQVVRLTAKTQSMYKRLDETNRAEYEKLAEHAWGWAMEWYFGMFDSKWDKPKKIDAEKFVAKTLAGYNPVTQYIYNREVERKQMRLNEAILTAKEYMDREQLKKAVKKAADLWYTQSSQYGVDILLGAMEETYESAGVTRLMWNSMEDTRVCEVCDSLNGKIFRVENYPPRQHYGCRCYPTPV